MTASEIAETLINGNISDARNDLLNSRWEGERPPQEVAILTLEVLDALAFEIVAGGLVDGAFAWRLAHNRLRCCLEG